MVKKTLYTYILREQGPPVLVCLAGVFFVLMTGQLLELTRILFASSCSLKDLGEIVLYAMPNLILYGAPMATLLGVMLAFVRLNSDNELIAFRAAGTGFLGFLPPVLGVLLFATVLSFINAIFILPVTNQAFEIKLRLLGRASIPALLKEGAFISDIPKLVFFLSRLTARTFRSREFSSRTRDEPKEKVTIAAESALIVITPDSNTITFRLANGVITRAAQNLKDAQAVTFKNYDFILSMDDIMGAAEQRPGT